MEGELRGSKGRGAHAHTPMDSLIVDFLQESNDNLNRLDQEFVSLEQDPKNAELLGSIFRTIHTIKGTCGFLGFQKLESLTHVGENLLSQLRAGELDLTPESADALLEMVDAIREVLREIEATGTEGTPEHGELIEKLKSLQASGTKAGGAAPGAAGHSTAGHEATPTVAAPATPPAATSSSAPEGAAGNGQTAHAGTPANVQVTASSTTDGAETKSDAAPAAKHAGDAKKAKISVVASRLGGALVRLGKAKPEDILLALQQQEEGDMRRLGEILITRGVVKERDIEEALSGKNNAVKQTDTIRVDVNLLESQMNLISELVLLRNQLLQKSANAQDRELDTTVHGLNLVTSELRKNVMKARMQPVSGLYEKLPRLVRDISKDLGKKVQLETHGGETELDKTLLEAIKDPVTHILRNSMDHGIEVPKKRVDAGKSEEGTIRVRAYHEGGNFHLELADDGAGIDVERVKAKAIEKGILNAGQAQKMTESEAQALLFAPGFSTAEKVTSVSGRGVGMDVVKTNIERIGGLVKLESEKGKGTTVHLEIPLTLATIPALTVVSARNVFAIPQAALVEMLYVDAEQVKERIEDINGAHMLRFRGAVLPLLSLRKQFELTGGKEESDGSAHIAVVQCEGRQFGIQVDVIRHNEEIVIKPLEKHFKKIGMFAGAAILGDGSVALILDLVALARHSGMSKLADEMKTKAEQAKEQKRKTLVLVSASHGERMAVPIEFVERLESLDEDAREQLGGKDVMQYRSQILRLVRLEDMLDERRIHARQATVTRVEEGKFPAVVVRGKDNAPVIFEVGRILGIVNTDVSNLTASSRTGVDGTLVVQEKVTELLNIELLLERAKDPAFEARMMATSEAGVTDGR